MKIFLTIIITAVLTWFAFSFIQSVRTGVERLWLISAVKVPGKMAIEDIQKDMNEGRYDIAKAKLQIFKDTWQRFNKGPDSNSGFGIGDIMVAFSKIDTNQTKSDFTTNKNEAVHSGTK
jgi:hypothetical protein